MTEETKRPATSRLMLRIVLGIVLFLILAWNLTMFAVDRKVESIRAAAEEIKPLMKPQDWMPEAPPAGELNASDFLESAVILAEGQASARALRGSQLSEDVADVRDRLKKATAQGTAPSDEDLAAFRAAIANYERPFALLDDAWEQNATASHYPSNFDGVPIEVKVPNLLARMRLNDMVAARAFVAAAEGRAEDAWEDAALTWRLADWTTRELPTLINTLVGRAMAVRASHLTQSLISSTPPDAATRAIIAREARAIDPIETMNYMYEIERSAFYVSMLDPNIDLEALIFNGDELPRLATNSWTRRPWMRLNASLYLEAATKTFELCAQPSHEHVADVEQQIKETKIPKWAVVAQQGIFGCLDTAHKRDNWQAMIDMTQIAMRLEEIREMQGEYPEVLGAAGEGRKDLFSGESYRYAKDAGGYRLWSVSADGIDDGGTLPEPRMSNVLPLESGDWVWRVRREPAILN